MKLTELLSPLTIEEFKTSFFGRRAFVRPAPSASTPGSALARELVTIEEVEVRLNDACATVSGLTLINEEGDKFPQEDFYCPQPVPTWNRAFLRKTAVHEKLRAGCSFVMHNMTHINLRLAELVRDIEETFDGAQADVHLYVSPQKKSTGYRVHRDQPQHKIYIQVVGSTEWTIFSGKHERRALSDLDAEKFLKVDYHGVLEPGSFLYMPPGVYHKATNPSGPRLSVSIPFYKVPGSFTVDRHPIPLAQMMRRKKEGGAPPT